MHKNLNSESHNLTRREFLRSSLMGYAWLCLGVPNPLAAKTSPQTPSQVLPKFKIMGRTNLKVSTLSLGAGHCMDGGVVYAAIKKGVTFIETSRHYSEGNNEKIIGEVLQSIPRNKVVVCTKFYEDPVYRNIVRSAHESLKNLKIKYIDLLLCHNVKDVAYLKNPEVKRALSDLKAAGVIKYCGASTHDLSPIAAWMLKDQFYDVLYCYFNIATSPEEIKLLKALRNSGIGIMGMKCLTGMFEPVSESTDSAIRYAISRDFIDTAVISMTNFQHLQQNLAALEKPYTEEDYKQLKLMFETINRKFCRSCNHCLSSCRYKLPIPDLMRELMYLEGYGNNRLAAQMHKELNADGLLARCGVCPQCTAQCAHSLIIPQRLKQLQARLRTEPWALS